MHFYNHINFRSVRSTALFKNACVNRKIMCACSVVSDSLRPRGLQPARLFCPWGFPGKNTGVGYQSLLQGIFLSQGSSPRLLRWQAASLPLSHQNTPTEPRLAAVSRAGGLHSRRRSKREAAPLLACFLSSLTLYCYLMSKKGDSSVG